MITSRKGKVHMEGYESEMKDDLAVIIRTFWESKLIKTEDELKEILQAGRDSYVRHYKEKTMEQITIDVDELRRQMKNGDAN